VTPTATLGQVWREPSRGSFANPAIVALPGLEQVRTFLDGRSPPAPVARLVGRRLVEVGEGSATMTMPASDWILGPKGRVHTGMLVFLADAPLLLAIQTTLPPFTFCTTAELSMTFLGEAPAGGGAGADLDLEVVAEPEQAEPDPHLRPLTGEVRDRDVHERLSGLELLRAQVTGELPLPPIHHLTGIRPVAAEHGTAAFALPACDWLRNEFGQLFGGAIGMLAKSAVAGAVQTTAPAGTGYIALDVKVNHLRPVVADDRDLVATGWVVHGGRRLAIASAEVVDADGEVVAIATGTTMVGKAGRRPA